MILGRWWPAFRWHIVCMLFTLEAEDILSVCCSHWKQQTYCLCAVQTESSRHVVCMLFTLEAADILSVFCSHWKQQTYSLCAFHTESSRHIFCMLFTLEEADILLLNQVPTRRQKPKDRNMNPHRHEHCRSYHRDSLRRPVYSAVRWFPNFQPHVCVYDMQIYETQRQHNHVCTQFVAQGVNVQCQQVCLVQLQ